MRRVIVLKGAGSDAVVVPSRRRVLLDGTGEDAVPNRTFLLDGAGEDAVSIHLEVVMGKLKLPGNHHQHPPPP
jgi:hypothetical protein